MRRPLSVLPIAALAGLAIVLTGCSGATTSQGGVNGFDDDGCATAGPASESVKVSGDFGAAPKVEFADDLSVEHTQRSVVIEGDGKTAAEPGGSVTADLVLYDVASSKELLSSGFSGTPETFDIDESALLAGMIDTLNCAVEGDRIVGVVPADRAFGAEGASNIGIGADATLLFVVDVVKVTAPPKPEAWTDDVPAVTRDDKGIPTVTLPEGDMPTTLKLAVLEAGDGKVVKSGDSVTVDYQGTSWDTKKVFDQSFGGEPATFSTSGVIKGFEAALVGQKVGSTVIVVIPPELAYGTDPDAHELGGQTLVFLIDIKDTARAGE